MLPRAQKNLEKGNVAAAYSKYLNAARKYEGLPEWHTKAMDMARELERRLEELGQSVPNAS